ncbi:MAG: hypothetical protein AAFZ92_00975 [Pseudomonadota bacterium]
MSIPPLTNSYSLSNTSFSDPGKPAVTQYQQFASQKASDTTVVASDEPVYTLDQIVGWAENNNSQLAATVLNDLIRSENGDDYDLAVNSIVAMEPSAAANIITRLSTKYEIKDPFFIDVFFHEKSPDDVGNVAARLETEWADSLIDSMGYVSDPELSIFAKKADDALTYYRSFN